jgi:hypothetical protein
MDRLACALGGKTVLPHILSNVNTMLGHGKRPRDLLIKTKLTFCLKLITVLFKPTGDTDTPA